MVECSRRKRRGNVQSGVGFRVCVGMKGIDLSQSDVVETIQDADSVFNTGGKQNGGEGMKMGYIYLSSCDFFIQLVLLVNEHKTAPPASC
jgi:hypothetical protein